MSTSLSRSLIDVGGVLVTTPALMMSSSTSSISTVVVTFCRVLLGVANRA